MLRRIIPFFIGISFIIAGIVFMVVLPKKAESKIERCTADTVGTVTECVERYDDDGTTYDLTIEYKVDGKSYTEIANQGENRNIGYEYQIHYNPDDPNDCVIDGVTATPKTLRIFGLAIMIIGIVVTLSQLFRLMRGR